MRAKRKTSKKKTRQDLISQAEVCKRLGISVRTLKRRRVAGKFGHYKFGSTIKFDAREIEAYKRAHRVGPPLPPNLHLHPLPPNYEDAVDDASVPVSTEINESRTDEIGGQS